MGMNEYFLSDVPLSLLLLNVNNKLFTQLTDDTSSGKRSGTERRVFPLIEDPVYSSPSLFTIY